MSAASQIKGRNMAGSNHSKGRNRFLLDLLEEAVMVGDHLSFIISH
jgi:hypothetical protein